MTEITNEEASAELRISVDTFEKDDRFVAVVREQRLDANNAVFFRNGIERFLGDGHRKIVLDLAAVEFIDSSGLGALVSSLKAVSGSGELVLCAPQNPVTKMFELTRMDRVFVIYPSVDDALAAA